MLRDQRHDGDLSGLSVLAPVERSTLRDGDDQSIKAAGRLPGMLAGRLNVSDGSTIAGSVCRVVRQMPVAAAFKSDL